MVLTVGFIPLALIMNSLPIISPVFANSFKADTCCEVRVHFLHSQDQHGRYFSRHCKWHYMSLAHLNRHTGQVLDEHAPVCRRKVRQRRPRPWTYEYVGPWPRPCYSSVADQLRELKRERLRAERGWRSSLDRI